MKVFFTLLLSLNLLMSSPIVYAGPLTDKFSVCLLSKTTNEDKQTFAKWMFAAISNNDSVKSLSNITKEHGEQLNQSVANLFTDLVTNRCKDEARDSIKYEMGVATLEGSFNVLEKVAIQSIMSDPNVGIYMSGLLDHLSIQKLNPVFSRPPLQNTLKPNRPG